MASFDRRNKVGFKELNPELAEYIRKTRRDLDNHMADNERHLNPGEREHWNGYEPRISALERAMTTVSGPDSPTTALQKAGMLYIGTGGGAIDLGGPTEINTYYSIKSQGMIPEAGNYKLCNIAQTAIYLYICPATTMEVYVAVSYYAPVYQDTSHPGNGIDYALAMFNIGRLTTAVPCIAINSARFHQYTINGFAGHGRIGYLVDVFKICAVRDPIPGGSRVALDVNVEGEVYVNGFDNVSQFPIRYAGLDNYLYPYCNDALNWMHSMRRISLSPITSL